MNKTARELMAFIRDCGGYQVEYDDRGEHGRILFTHNGRKHVEYVSRGSGGMDRRALRNLKAKLRRNLGVKRIKSVRPPRQRAERPKMELPELTTLPDWRDALRELK